MYLNIGDGKLRTSTEEYLEALYTLTLDGQTATTSAISKRLNIAPASVTEMLRKKKVVGKFVEYFGDGLAALSLADRATIANMAPEYGATMGFFPVDAETLKYLRLSGRSEHQVKLVEAYCKAQGLFHETGAPDPVYSDTLELDLSTVVPSLAGPKRPQDRIPQAFQRGQRRWSVQVVGHRVGKGNLVRGRVTGRCHALGPAYVHEAVA